MTPQEKFLFELNIFRNEVTLVTRSLYMELAIHAIASKNKSILKVMNRTPTFWNAVLGGFQSSTFITLGRIFDKDSKHHSIHTLFRLAQDNKTLFSRTAFEERWKAGDNGKSQSMIDYLPKYMEKFYEPTDNDFRKLKKQISTQQKIYENIYSPIRHNFGHKIYSTNEEVKVIFEKVDIRELEKFCTTLDGIHESLWQLYHNGRGPMVPIRRKKSSTQYILSIKPKPHESTSQNVQYINEVKYMLTILNAGYQK